MGSLFRARGLGQRGALYMFMERRDAWCSGGAEFAFKRGISPFRGVVCCLHYARGSRARNAYGSTCASSRLLRCCHAGMAMR